MPDESTILRFRHLLETHGLAAQMLTLVNEILSEKRLKAGIRAKVEHPFRVLRQQFGYTKTRCRGLMKNTAQLTTLFALGNIWMSRRALSKA